MATYDYKEVDRRGKPASQGVPGWLWLAIGLGVGLAVAFMAYLLIPTAGSRLHFPLPPSATTPAKTDTRAVLRTPFSELELDSEPAPPRFDFYTILPEMEVAIPDSENVDEPTKSIPVVEQEGTYILQAGSFKTAAEADRLRANLILEGIEATIQTVTIDNKDTWHRVHIGPYQELKDVNDVRARLKESKIEAILLKVKS